ncbi:class I SAM-dependent methyltransferase [Halomarina oriensis]|uniref:Methyltransferase domain-containing protein n=1 Tax=Halomarina oriensis TaxID=671145 RepID=A0A6B0GME0_9EURY|nr:class I SAM-dependent methyltransferase [Halomarina oriensis]MWG34649.1 methyltransferase domain-containing protein [Halomarina oriensis]
MTDDDPVALDAYETMADAYSERVGEKPFNAFLERPATRALLPEPDGQRVLDAGCGPGVTTRELREAGADVVGLDVSPKMLGHARARAGDRVVRADLGSPLPFSDDSFDGVHSSLALHYVSDWPALFGELARVLVPGGWLVCSVQHPYADFERVGEDYFAAERIEETWDGFGGPVDVPFFRRPLDDLLNGLLGAGFRFEAFDETEPTEQFREASPETYERVSREPTFLAVRGRLDG